MLPCYPGFCASGGEFRYPPKMMSSFMSRPLLLLCARSELLTSNLFHSPGSPVVKHRLHGVCEDGEELLRDPVHRLSRHRLSNHQAWLIDLKIRRQRQSNIDIRSTLNIPLHSEQPGPVFLSDGRLTSSGQCCRNLGTSKIKIIYLCSFIVLSILFSPSFPPLILPPCHFFISSIDWIQIFTV